MYHKSCFWALAILTTLVGLAQGEVCLDGGLGYARLSLEGSRRGDLVGWGSAFHFWFGDAGAQDGLRPFLGLHSTMYPGDSHNDAVWGVWMFTPEVGLAWHQRLGDSGFFLEPSVTGGAAIATYTRRGNPRTVSYYIGEDDTAVGWVVRPGVLLGYQRGTWTGGVEASYGLLDIDFTHEVSGTHRELYIGLFGRFSW
jgi:hypothetical protein